jgi:hypothetical protein
MPSCIVSLTAGAFVLSASTRLNEATIQKNGTTSEVTVDAAGNPVRSR